MNLIEHYVGGKVIPGNSDRKAKIFNAFHSMDHEALYCNNHLCFKSGTGSLEYK